MDKFKRSILQHVEIKIEGRDRKPLKAIVKDSDQIGRVTLGKSLGRRKLLILAIEYSDPHDRIFIEMKNKSKIPPESTETTRETEIHKSSAFQLDTLDVRALRFILQEFSSRREPSMRDVAAHLDISPRELGTVLKPLGIQAQSTSRDWKHMRLYPFKLRTKIEALLEELET